MVVFPPTANVFIGNSSSFACNVTSSLDYTISWNFNGNSQPPEGVVVNGAVVVIPSAQPYHFGTYTCQADDQVNVRSFQAMLFVNCELDPVISIVARLYTVLCLMNKPYP